MSRLHRFILLCLLAVSIPLQGYAAAATLHCGIAAAPASMGTACDGMDMTESMPLAGDDHATHQAADGAIGSHAMSHKGSCSACAVCCVVAAPGMAFTPSFATAPADLVDLPNSRPRVAFLTGGPERPPRQNLA